MKQQFIKQSGSSELLLFFAGWGMDATPFASLAALPMDVALCYDYTSLAWDETPYTPYQSITLCAWSMGVWVAAHLFSSATTLCITRSIAINGTHYPIDEERGIPPAIFAATLANVTPQGVKKFQRRMCCGDRELLAQFQAVAPQRTPQELEQELAAIQEAVVASPPPTFRWGRVVIGSGDLIFSPENQQRAWHNHACVVVDAPHYLDFLNVIADE